MSLRIGLVFDKRGSLQRDYFGSGRWEHNKNFVKVDLPKVSQEIKRAVELTKPIWSHYQTVPLAAMDEGKSRI